MTLRNSYIRVCLSLEVYKLKIVSRVFIIAVMLVAFIGQALAFHTAMPCDTVEDSPLAHSTELVKHFDSTLIDTASPNDCCGIECCSTDCTCIVNACSSLVYLNTQATSINTVALCDIFYIQPLEQTNPITALLYRPPIVIS